MSDANERTIAAYDAHVQAYIDNTPQEISRTAKEWFEASLDGLPSDVRILEIGSGFGHDAAYIEKKGYSVERSDVAPGFVDLLRSKGHDVQRINVLTDRIVGPYDLIIANAVFHHFTKIEAVAASRNVLGALGIGGRFAVSMRIGLQEGWSEEKLGVPRYFTRWDHPRIEEVLKGVGFASIVATDRHKANASWAHLTARKQ